MTPAADAVPPAERSAMHRLRRIWPVVPLVCILAALMLSDLGDFMGYSPFESNSCSLSDAPQSSISAKMYMPIARWALRYTPTPSVAILYIDPAHDPADQLTNVCASRAFLGRLVGDLNKLQAHVIVIDKYYSANACAVPGDNAAFLAGMINSKVPIVVGQATHALAEGSNAPGCLALTPRLDLSNATKVHYGLTRLNNDDLKVPLRWPVFPDPATTNVTPAANSGSTKQPVASSTKAASDPLSGEEGDTLSLTAARMVDPRIEQRPGIAKLLTRQIDPYTTFLKLPNITALTAMCSAEPSPRAPIDGQPGDTLCTPWTRSPDDLNGSGLSLAGKVVVIGDLSDQDMKPFPTNLAPFPPGQRPGVYLQANYVQALLDHRFLLELPMSVTVSLLVVYVLVVYCLYWAHDEEGKPRLSAERAGLWSLAVLASLVLLSFLALVMTSSFTPLWALWGAGVFMVFRYLEASGHHRSQHLMGHLARHHHTAAHSAEATSKSGADPEHETRD